jgi:hypothetical protein
MSVWKKIGNTDQYVRDDGTDTDSLVAINKLGPYLGEPSAKWVVTGINYGEATAHPSLEGAIGAADDRLPPRQAADPGESQP